MKPIDAIGRMLESSGMSKKDLGDCLGRSKESIYNMFRERPDVKMSTMLAACEATGFTMALSDGKGESIEVDLPDDSR